MKKLPFALLSLPALAGLISACSIKGIAEKTVALQPGVRYEVRTALAPDALFKPQHVAHYYFMLDAPANVTPDALLTDDRTSNRSVRTTAYCHTESDHVRYGHLAAAGGDLKFGLVCSAAADWSRYPLGTKFRIASQPGVVYEVDDYGSALVGSSTIDLYRPTFGSMNAWGVRNVDIEILHRGSYDDSLRLLRKSIHFPHVRRMVSDIQRRIYQASANSVRKMTPVTAMNAPMMAALPGLSFSM